MFSQFKQINSELSIKCMVALLAEIGRSGSISIGFSVTQKLFATRLCFASNILFFAYFYCAILQFYSLRSPKVEFKHWSTSGNIPVTLRSSICGLRPDATVLFFLFLTSSLLRIALHSKPAHCLGAMSPIVGIPGEFHLLPDLPQVFFLPLPLPLPYPYIVARHPLTSILSQKRRNQSIMEKASRVRRQMNCRLSRQPLSAS